MEDKCRKYWRPLGPCLAGQALSLPSGPACASPAADSPKEHQGSIAFGAANRTLEQPLPVIPMPRFDVPGPMMKTVRDPALSLNALSGVDPSGPVMVEVPVVQNNSTFAPTQVLAGWRIGFAERYVHEGKYQPVEQSAAFIQALAILRQAGAQLVPVDAQRADDTLQFNVQTRSEIDDHVTENRLDALVSESNSAAFHGAGRSGYPSLGEPLADGTTLWFFGAQWARDSLGVLVRAYRQSVACGQ